MRPYLLPVAVRTAALAAVSAAGWVLAATSDAPDANIGLGLAVLATLVLVAGIWAGIDGVRGARRGDPDRPGLLMWLAVALATGVLQSLLVVVQEAIAGHLDEVRVIDLVRGALTFAGFVGVPAAVVFGLAGSATTPRTGPQPGR